MAVVHLTQNLRRFFPDLGEETVSADTVSDVIYELDLRFTGLASYVVADDGSQRKHVHSLIDRQPSYSVRFGG